MTENHEEKFIWKFQRRGNFDQVILEDGECLRRLGELDPKLWVALSCPTADLEFDARTLELMDKDGDGRIRMPEVVEAVAWACGRLAEPGKMIEPPLALPLSFIKNDAEEGQRLFSVAKAVLEEAGRPEGEDITVEEASQAVASAVNHVFNGDGIMPDHESLEPEIRQFIRDALAVTGGVTDASGSPGVNSEICRVFIKSLEDWQAWRQNVSGISSPLGQTTPEAWDLMAQLSAKIDDYFLRCQMVSFAPQTAAILNVDERSAPSCEHGFLTAADLVDLPLAYVEADRPLILKKGLNPAWNHQLERFFALLAPLLPNAEQMTREDWEKIKISFNDYAAVLAAKPAATEIEVEFPPAMASLEELGPDRIKQILEEKFGEKFEELLNQDAQAPTATAEIADLERLVRYHAHLYRFLMNFVSFRDFYAAEHRAVFQAGTLYLDGRSCRLCLPVSDVGQHVVLAALSELCLVYCECRRKGKNESAFDQKRLIVAAVTAGDSDFLMEGRNGVFVDNQGLDWDATVVKIVVNAIGLWQAVWAPYKRAGRFINEQAVKFAGAKSEDAATSINLPLPAVPAGPAVAAPSKAASVSKTAAASKAAAAAPKAVAPPFDIGKSVGIFAAIGLALGALGTAAASLARSFFALSWWQLPLVFLGLFLLISGPSMFMAWLKLRKRTIGPLLEASGWAVNGRVAIDLFLGGELTGEALLPPGGERESVINLKKPASFRLLILIICAVILAGAAVWFWLYRG